ncbi:MAG: MFS transporter [Candidatus Hodarchaeota archaeon]
MEEKKQSNNKKKVFKYRSLLPLWIAIFIDILGFSLIFPMVGYFKELFNTSQTMIGLVFSVNAMFGFIFGPILGKLSDKFGRRPLLLISQLGTCIAFIMLAFSTSLEMLFISRMVDGIFGGNFPIAKAIVSDEVPPRDRGIQMANVGVAHVLASLIGPAIGGILFTLGGIFLPGLFAAGLSIITMILTIILLKESWPKEKRIHHQQIEIKVDQKIRQNKNAVFFLILFGFHTISFMIAMSSISFFGANVLNLQPPEISFILMMGGIVRAVIRFTAFKPTVKKLGETNAIRLGLLIFVICFFLFGVYPHVVMLFILLMFVSFAASLSRGPLNSKISQTVSPKIQGKINGLSSALDMVAQIIGPITAAFMLDTFAPLWLGILIGLIALPPCIMAFQNLDLKKYKTKNLRE